MSTPRIQRSNSVLVSHTPRAATRTPRSQQQQAPSPSPTRSTPRGSPERDVSALPLSLAGGPSAKERINVFVRPRQSADAQQVAVEIDEQGNSVGVRYGEVAKHIACDGAFDASATQEQVFAKVAPRMVDAIVEKGWSACIFAYVRPHTRNGS